MAAKKFTEDDVLSAFWDGITVGIASEIGTFGTEDFMGKKAAFKADRFCKREIKNFGSLLAVYQYCGGYLEEDENDFPPTSNVVQ